VLAKAKIGIFGLEPSLPFQPEGILGYNFWTNLKANLPNVEFRSIGMQFALLMMVLWNDTKALIHLQPNEESSKLR